MSPNSLSKQAANFSLLSSVIEKSAFAKIVIKVLEQLPYFAWCSLRFAVKKKNLADTVLKYVKLFSNHIFETTSQNLIHSLPYLCYYFYFINIIFIKMFEYLD
jgi:hypothetical protein